MFSHVVLGVADFERALSFYQAVLGVLHLEQRFIDRSGPWAGWQSAPGPRPLFVIARPFDGAPHAAGNGQMAAFTAPSRAAVDQAHATALQHGGRSEGAPGLRPQYHEHYYGAYMRDPEGNKLCVVCHAPPTAAGPEQLVQRQLEAYNAKDVEAWLQTYAPDAEQYELHGARLARGHDEMRQRIQLRFAEPDLHAELLSRSVIGSVTGSVIGSVVVDHERITRNFPEGRGRMEMLCVYQVEGDRIVKASFAAGAAVLDPKPLAA